MNTTGWGRRGLRTMLIGLLLHSAAAAADRDADVAEFKRAYAAYQAHIEAGDGRAAVPEARIAHELGQALFGSDHENALILSQNYGVALLQTYDFNGAIDVLEPLTDRFRRRFGKQSEQYLQLLRDIGLACSNGQAASRQRARCAAERYDEAIDVSEALYGERDPRTLAVIIDAGDRLGSGRHLQTARNLLRRAHEALDGIDDDDLQPLRRRARFQYGKLLIESGDHEDGIELLEPLLAELDGDTSSAAMRMAGHAALVGAYESIDQRDAATPHCRAIAVLAPERGEGEVMALYRTPPKAPMRMTRQVGSAEVTVGFEIDTAGFASNFSELENNASTRYYEAAVEAISRWRFAPAVVDGEPVVSRAIQTVKFGP